MRVLASEFLKVTTTRMWWLLAIIMFAYLAFIAGGLAALFGFTIANPDAAAATGASAPSLGDMPLAPLIYSFATSMGYVFAVIIGVLAVTGEFRHRTLTVTFLATPQRTTVLGAKLLAQLPIGAGFGVIAFLASVGAGAAMLAVFGLDTLLDQSDTWAMIGRGILAMALWAAIGAALGSVVPNQVAAIVIVLAFTQFVEPLLRLATSFSDATAAIGKFLPGSASDALVGASFYALATPGGAAEMLVWWQGGLVLLGIAVVLAVIGGTTSWRRDVS
ncbi:ABC transporter permease [Agromyces mediolanus]|uniref:ABC transporter permease n=1 Tax=Agromyces mediolanus TaxID=41986 RepID=UPI001E2919FF|nr:ABC transporter permease [Agromyces mediolanus]MCD1571430.1 ABC transporter permease [Agromyces mediolanus]